MEDRFTSQLIADVVTRLRPELKRLVVEALEEHDRGEKPRIVPKALNSREAAAYIGRSLNAMFHLVARGEIPCVRRGRSLRFLVADLDRWLLQDRV